MTDSRQVTARPHPLSAPDRFDLDTRYARPRRAEPPTLVDEMSGLLVPQALADARPACPLALTVAW